MIKEAANLIGIFSDGAKNRLQTKRFGVWEIVVLADSGLSTFGLPSVEDTSNAVAAFKYVPGLYKDIIKLGRQQTVIHLLYCAFTRLQGTYQVFNTSQLLLAVS